MSDATTPANCTSCGAELPAGARFCPQCGHPVAAAARTGTQDLAERILTATSGLEGERKLVTVLFADLKGSTELIADRDPEEARRLLDPVLEHMCEAVEKFGGTVSQVLGDGVMALFGAPVSWEDHAVRACHAALSMQDLVRHYGDDIQRAYGIPIQIRVGLHSGEVVLNVTGHGLHMSYTATGQAVHLASRMEQMAKPGSVLATADTVRLAEGHIQARPIGPVRVKGFERPIEVAEIGRVTARRSRFDRAPSRAMTPFTGRSGELERLLEWFSKTISDGTGRVAVVVGEAGIGKSRLVHEFLHAVSRRNVLALDGGAAPYGSGAGYRPGVHILRQYFDIAETDDVRALQEKVAGRIVALDGDANVIGAPLLALLRALPDNHRFFGLPVGERQQRVFAALMWLASRMTADRPMVLAYEDLQWVTSDTRDFLDAFIHALPPSTLVLLTFRADYDAGWLADRERLELALDGLPPAAIRQIISDLLGDDPSLVALKDELPRRSGGNPLFVEEYVRSMVDAGDLVGQPGHYRLATLQHAETIPPTVRAVLAARIDRLQRADKYVLQTIAAIGEVATVSLLERVGGMPADELRRSLRRLEKAGLLVERAESGRFAYEFKHSLTQAVAYDTLLQRRRRQLHLDILTALDGSGDVDVLARHAVLGEAWDRALSHLCDAGRLAAAHFASVEAVAYFERALDVVQQLPPSRRLQETTFDIHCELRNALVPLGRHERLLEVLEAARRIAEALEDERRLAQVYSFLANYYGQVGDSELALETGERALVLGERVGAGDLLVIGNMGVGEIYRTLGNYPKARDYLTRAVALIRPEDEHGSFGQVGLPSVRARSHLAWTLAELGDFPGARECAGVGIRVADDSHHAYSICHACLGLGGMRVRQGDFESAITVLTRGFALSEQVPLLRPPIAADLGYALAHCGRVDEGLSYVDAAVGGATRMGRKSRLPLLLAKCGAIHLLAGERGEATRLATMALELAVEQKERGNEAYARHLFGEIHQQSAAESAEARRCFADALALADELGMRPLAAHCHAGLASCCAAEGDPEGARIHRATALAMYREMGMVFWVLELDRDPARPGQASGAAGRERVDGAPPEPGATLVARR